MIRFDYLCSGCGTLKNNQELDCFACACGGTFRIADRTMLDQAAFEPHYNEVIKDYVYSWRDMEQKGKRFRSVDHPNGFVITQGNTRFMRELRHDYKHREELKQEIYAKSGHRYKPGQKMRFDEKRQELVSNRSRRTYFC